MAATITVSTSTDELTANGACSLREAIRNANATAGAAPSADCTAGNNAGSDTVIVPSGHYVKITMAGPDDDGLVGDFDIKTPMVIAGAGVLNSAVSGNQLDRVFDVRPGGQNVRISGLRIENGRTSEAGGGGITNQGTLILTNSLVTHNTATSVIISPPGGGIENNGDLTIVGTSVSGNSALGLGGGIVQHETGSSKLRIVNSIVSGNTASFGGGVYDEESDVLISGSVVTGNKANTSGGGVYLAGDPASVYNLSNVAITDNTAGDGAGLRLDVVNGASLTRLTVARNVATATGGGVRIRQEGTIRVALTESSISQNTAGSGGGVYIAGSGSGHIQVLRTIVNANRAGNGDGDGVWSSASSVTINNSTISGNGNVAEAGQGGGVWNGGTMTLWSSTISGNATSTAGQGGNVYNGGTMTARATLVNEALAGGNCGGNLITDDRSFEDAGLSALSCGITRNGNALLDPALANNGGPTLTHALLAGSPAINAASNVCESPDQRGVPRFLGGLCDIGAYERVLCFGQPVNRIGTNGANRMTGTFRPEVFLTLGGRDVVNPGGGNDRLCLGSGNDTARIRGNGTDRADGQSGRRDRVIRDSRDIVRGFERFG